MGAKLGGRAASAAVLALATAALCARALYLSRYHPAPAFDEVAYLDLARDFAERGGVLPTVGCYLRGACLEDNRHPLYMLLLAPAIRGGPEDFARAKLLSLACAVGLLWTVFLLSAIHWGRGVGLAAAAAVSLSPLTPSLAAIVSSDVLFAALYFAALMVLARWHRLPRAWAAFGLLVGLAYLAKGTGHFLFFSALACGLNRSGRRFFALPHLYLAAAAFAGAAFFLLWRNAAVWGSPFHNVNSSLLWFDGRQDTWSVRESPQWRELGLLWYLREHSPSHLLQRMTYGLGLAGWTLLKALALGTRSYPSWLLTGTGMLSLSLHGMRARWRQGHRDEVLALASAGAVLFLSFAWAAKGLGLFLRYMFPIAIPLLPMAAVGAREAAGRLGPGLKSNRALPAAQAGLALACLAALVTYRSGLRADPLRLWSVPPRWAQTSLWIREHVDRGGYLIDIMSPYSTWDCCRDTRRIYPFGSPREEIAGFLRRRGIRYALVDRSVAGETSSNPRYGPNDRFGPETFLGWKRCYHDSGAPSELLIYCEGAEARE